MGKRNYLIWVIFGLFLFIFFLFFSPQKTQAYEVNYQDVVINEVMWMGSTDDSNDEWLELKNMTTGEIDLTGWIIENAGSSHKSVQISRSDNTPCIIPAAGYFIIFNASKITTTKIDLANLYPNFLGVNLSLANSNNGDLILRDAAGNIIDQAKANPWPAGDNSLKASMERNDPPGDGLAEKNWHTAIDSVGFKLGSTEKGTPGWENSSVAMPPSVTYPDEVLALVNLDKAIIRQVQVSSVVDGDTIKVTGLEDFPSTIRLLFVDTPEEGQPFYQPAKDFTSQLLNQTVDLLISQDSDEQKDKYGRTLAVVIFDDQVFNTQLLEQGLASFYDYDNAVLKKDAWLAILQQAQKERLGLWDPAGKIILSELLPNPVGLDSEGEWIEIYNPTDDFVVLSRYRLDNYTIKDDTLIGPESFLVFHRFQTGIVLNNSGDTVQLFFPGGLLLDEMTYPQSSEGMSWALINGSWYQTSRLTPGEINILEIADAGKDEENKNEEINIPINSEPIEVKTGQYRNFENYLVKITGTVVETSGNTFYLDDGSGRAKVYIQAATGIEKPSMHKGDVFEVTGIVNLYRETWRILPQKQEDIKLIQAVRQDVAVKTSTAKKSTAKAVSAKKTSTVSKATARSPTSSSKQIASADDNGPMNVKAAKSPWWVQFFKALTGVALILLIILIVKIRQRRKLRHVLGGNFGDET